MKSFTDICKMSQLEVKEYAKKFLASAKYSPVVDDGFVYAKGDVPVLLVAHMDTVHKQLCIDIVKELKCSVLFCEDEEIGGVGARKFVKSDVFDDVDVNYIIEFDRKGNNDAVFYNCDHKDFTSFVCDNTGIKEA